MSDVKSGSIALAQSERQVHALALENWKFLRLGQGVLEALAKLSASFRKPGPEPPQATPVSLGSRGAEFP